MAQRSKEDVYQFLQRAEVGAVGTSNMGKPRQRMMHFAVDEDLTLYLTSMKGDPKVIQWSNIPETAILIHQGDSFMEMEECEIIGRAEVIRDEKEREKASDLLVSRSPIVAQFNDMDALDRLEFIKVSPYTVKYRFVPEILQGEKPTVFDFKDQIEKNTDKEDLKSRLRAWKEAVRPLSLTAALIPVLLGSAIAYSMTEIFYWGLFIFTLLGGLMIQAGTNMYNDFKDAERDSENTGGIRPFTGGSKMIQLGLISKADMGFFAILMILISAGIGIYLTAVAGAGLIPVILFGLLAGLFYTNSEGKFSFINAMPGLAEFFIATTYGVAMTLGAFYVQTGTYAIEPLLISLPVSLLITAVLLINQFPDAEADEASEKNTLIVRIGKRSGRDLLAGLFAVALILIVLLPFVSDLPLAIYLSLLSIPFMVQAVRYTFKYYQSQATDLIPGNAHTAIHHLFTGLLLVLGVLAAVVELWVIGLLFIASLMFIFWVWRYIERQRKVMSGFKEAFSTSAN